ncbi:MAG: DNA translocase FtsK [Flavobacteriales bacterium]|nr:DNA translocase FtsK [Flavobacteriales bacterium]
MEGNKAKGKSAKAAEGSGKDTGKATGAADPRKRTVIGLFLILLSIFFTLSFVSYLIHGFSDQSHLVDMQWADTEDNVQNWMGKLGAWTAHLMMYHGVGIAAFALPFLLMLLGLRVLLRKWVLPVGKSALHCLFLLYFLPLMLGFVSANAMLGGALGFQFDRWATSLMGSVGTGMMIFFAFFAYLIIVFKLSIDSLRPLAQFLFARKDTPLVAGATTASGAEAEQWDDPFLPTPDITVRTNDLDLTVTSDKEDEDEDFEEGELEIEVNVPERTVEPERRTPAGGFDENGNPVEFEIETVTTPVEQVVEEGEGDGPGEYDPTLDLSHYQIPPLDLLEMYGEGGEIRVDKEELESNKNRIVNTLKNYNIDIERIKATIGPTVTLYEIVPAPGIRISKIKNLEDDIALSLSALGIRIIAPIPGKGTIGIEVPNLKPDTVAMRTVLSSEKFQHAKMELPIALGKTISNETFVTDLTKMPHLLMAGATGQGKSVGLNAILASILYKKHPAQVKFVLVDPKKVELTLFNKIERHFLAKLPNEEEAIITDTQKVVNTLNSLCIEMDARYDLLKDAQCRNLKEYNAKFIARRLNPLNGHRFMPYIVLVVDEFADLIMTAGKEVEMPIARLAQLARAIGIHLIIATQRPSVNIITGTIKANFPARIAFRVTSKIDSRTILDSGGAEQLIGRGDMLLSTGNDLIRIQCAFIDTPEVERVVDFIGAQQAYPTALELPEYVSGDGEMEAGAVDLDNRDAMFADSARIVVQHQQGSASLLQRRLKLGYNRAGRIIDQLEAAGIIGPFEGSKARQVLIQDEVSLERILHSLDN